MPPATKESRALLADASLDLEHRTNYRFALHATLHMRSLAPLFAGKHQLTAAGWRVLGVVGRHEPVVPSALAELTSTDAYKVTRTVDRLVEMGLVERSTDAADRRRVPVRLSPRGRRVYEEIETEARALELRLRAAFTAPEWKRFAAALEKLEAQAQQVFAASAPTAPARAARRPAAAAKSAGAKAAAVRPGRGKAA